MEKSHHAHAPLKNKYFELLIDPYSYQLVAYLKQQQQQQ